MIVKKVANPDRSSSKAVRVMALTNYILNPQLTNKTEKCIYAGARGFISEKPHSQQREMIALSHAAARSPDPISHWVLSWAEGEQPTAAQVEEIVTIFLAELGLADHQVIFGVHADTSNWHLHLAINRVHPITERPVTPNRGFDREAAHRAICEIEAAQGWAREGGARYRKLENGDVVRDETAERVSPHQKAADFEHRTGEKSAERTAMEAVPGILDRATSWADLHRLMAAAGFQYRQKGSGALIYVGDLPIKASSAARGASLKKLVDRFGPFEADQNLDAPNSRSPEPLPAAGARLGRICPRAARAL